MENHIKYSKGVCWIGDCRIPFLKDEGYNYKNGPLGNSFSVGEDPDGKRTEPVESNPLGRFTPNLLVCDDMLNDGSVSKSNSGGISSGNNFGGLTQKHRDRKGVDDKGTNSRYYDLDKWFDKVIDEI